MFRVRLILLSVLVALAAGMIMSMSASAATNWTVCRNVGAGNGTYKGDKCKEEGGNKEWEIEPIRAGEIYELNGEGGESTLEASGLTIKCGSDTKSGLLETLGETEFKIEFASCGVVNHAACTVSKDVFELKGVLGATIIEGGDSWTELKLTFEPGSEVTISGCSLKQTIKLKGKMTCLGPDLLGMKEVHEIVCNSAGSEIEGESELEKVTGVKFTGTDEVRVYEIGEVESRKVWWAAE